MDRIISLLAAFVGLIALGGAILVHTHGQTEDQKMATEIAALQASLEAAQSTGMVAKPAPASAAADTGAADLLGLQQRIAALEQTTREQADQLQQARTELAARPAGQSAVEVATAEEPASSSVSAAIAADGPTTDCIPIGTRFMATAGDRLPICKTKAVVKVVAVSDGEAILEGIGSVVPGGGSMPLDVKGCKVTVFSADVSGYAELRVNCS